jgi:hypothetical protein
MTTKTKKRTNITRIKKVFSCAAPLFSAACLAVALTLPAYAAKPKPADPGATIIIHGDMGGSVRTRVYEIQQINRLRQRVEIRRGACMSSCTMFLGVHNVCVIPQAILGFHGPYRFGSKLTSTDV